MPGSLLWPSCVSRRGLEGADGCEDLAEDLPADRDLGQLEGDLAGVTHDPRAGLDEAVLDTCQRPVSDFFGQFSALEKAAKVVGQYMKLEPDCIVTEAFTGQPCPVDRVFAFLDVLFGCAALIVEADDPVRFHRQVGDDKAHAGKQIAGVPLDLCDDATGFAP